MAGALLAILPTLLIYTWAATLCAACWRVIEGVETTQLTRKATWLDSRLNCSTHSSFAPKPPPTSAAERGTSRARLT
jgi:hypothetical protein